MHNMMTEKCSTVLFPHRQDNAGNALTQPALSSPRPPNTWTLNAYFRTQ
jgi:hypothetical protein